MSKNNRTLAALHHVLSAARPNATHHGATKPPAFTQHGRPEPGRLHQPWRSCIAMMGSAWNEHAPSVPIFVGQLAGQSTTAKPEMRIAPPKTFDRARGRAQGDAL